jgi:ribonucleotide monophosphatase NagD (HAD superfamily)
MKESRIDNLYVIGSDGFRSELEGHGLRIVDNDSAENLVVGLDYDFNYKKIAAALAVLLKGGKFIACNEDASFPVGQNKYMPGCGAMVGTIAASANKRPDFIVGKPHTYILSIIAKEYGVEHDEIVVVGDSYESDIMMALNYDSKAILVNSKNKVVNKNILFMDNLNKVLTYIKEH